MDWVGEGVGGRERSRESAHVVNTVGRVLPASHDDYGFVFVRLEGKSRVEEVCERSKRECRNQRLSLPGESE